MKCENLLDIVIFWFLESIETINFNITLTETEIIEFKTTKGRNYSFLTWGFGSGVATAHNLVSG